MSIQLTSACIYSFSKKVPQNQPVGICLNIDDIVEQEEPINDLKRYFTNLSQDVAGKKPEVKESLRGYAKSMGYELINKQMRNSTVDRIDMSQHIKNILSSLQTYGFIHPVRLFRTEADDYKQNVNGKMISSRKLSPNDSWNFTSFISTAVTNRPSLPKVQSNGKITVFVFEFKTDQDIKGLYLGQSEGMEGEAEFLLAPGIAKVTEVYKQKIGIGYIVKKAKFVVCNLQFPKIR